MNNNFLVIPSVKDVVTIFLLGDLFEGVQGEVCSSVICNSALNEEVIIRVKFHVNIIGPCDLSYLLYDNANGYYIGFRVINRGNPFICFCYHPNSLRIDAGYTEVNKKKMGK